MISRAKKNFKAVAYFLLLDMCISIIMPSMHAVHALTSGPGSPEFSSFEPVATTNLVDPYTGGFTYNLPVIQIPGPDGGGYAMSLSYHSGTSSEEDASWVGHGWSLNPGAINRSVRGYPDEYNNGEVDVYNKNRPNWSMSGTAKANIEFFSKSQGEGGGEGSSGGGGDPGSGGDSSDNSPMESKLKLSLSTNIRYNNYQGLAKTVSFGLAKSFGSLSMNRSATGITYSANINPLGIIDGPRKFEHRKAKEANAKTKQKQEKEGWYKVSKERSTGSRLAGIGASSALGTYFSFQSFTDQGQATSLSKLRGYNFNLSFGAEVNPSQVPIGFEGGLIGGFSLNYAKPFETVLANGYLNTKGGIGKYRSDYLVEKGQAFDRRDYFIGIPFSTPDSYMLTGEGLSGGFRPYRKSIGTYFPEEIGQGQNKINTFGLGFEVMFGVNIGVGINLAFGNTKSSIKDWKRSSNTNDAQFSFDANDDILYRFTGDMGSKIEYGNNEIALARLNPSPNFPGLMGVTPSLNPNEVKDLEINQAKVSSFINDTSNEKFTIYSDAGLRYKYTLPVNNKNTAAISIDANKTNAVIDNNYIAYKDLNMDANYLVNFAPHQAVLGENKKTPYASMNLLESITTPDYVDVGNNGPDKNDFGGWTSFKYHKKAGENNANGDNEWLRWRIPYNGLLYNKNSISDLKDDTGFVSTGEKELFYLKQVETKTHIAYYVTNKSTPERFGLTASDAQSAFLSGTQAIRKDGLTAPGFSGGKDLAANDVNSKGPEKLEYLEKIVLFSKARPELPLQTTNFQYSYSLVPNVPNNVYSNQSGNSDNYNISGKLTLEKVWSEFEGIHDARISSYKFDYRYKDKANYPNYLYEDQPSLTGFLNISDRYSVNAQNPAYGPHLLDAWGYNQYDGENRHLKLRNWPYQGDISSNSNYDPAAWQLKQITLPSGGQILVEYESKDYLYVQDRPVMTLVKVKSYDDSGVFPTINLDLSDIGIKADDVASKTALVKALKKYFFNIDESNTPPVGEPIEDSKRVYFKFLYDLEGNSPSLENCKSEYITGYAKVNSIKLNGNDLSIVLNGKSAIANLIGFGLTENPQPDSNYQLTPKQACYDFYVTQRWGKYTAGCEGEFEARYERSITKLADNDRNGGSLITEFKDLVKIFKFTATGISALADGATNKKYPSKGKVCKTFNADLSYLKIPMNRAKRGGGVRVKRLLMYDKGIENGDAAIYGQEYKYELQDGRSSGVASNEPGGMREDNALVDFLPKENQSWLNRLISGKDREQSEGPIGETLLPAPLVGHSRVVVENIHKGQTGTGYVVNEYFTCKDYPFDKTYDYRFSQNNSQSSFDIGESDATSGVEYSVLQDNSYDDKLRIPTPNFSYSLDKAWASQGFRFILNDMSGKPKSVRTYGGDYASGDTSFISSGQDFYYYEPGEQVVLLKPDGTYYKDIPGKEMDVTMEKYRLYNQNLDFNFEVDVSVGIMFPPPIFVSGNLSFSFGEQMLSKYAVSKVIRYPAIQKSVVSYSDNIASETENLAFDAETGNSILTRSYDAYHNIPLHNSEETHDGSIYNLNTPAHWHYAALGKKSVNANYSNQLKSSVGQVITYGKNANPINGGSTWNVKQDRVISANANTYAPWTVINVGTSNDNARKDYVHQIYNSNVTQEASFDKVLRPHKSFVFKGNTKNSSDRETVNGKIYEGGVLDEFVPFNYVATNQDQRWIKINEATLYSPHGNVLEEKNVLGVYSSAKFGYEFTQPIMVSQNAEFSDTYFEHFEDKLSSGQFTLNDGFAHSGNYSRIINSAESLLQNVKPSVNLAKEGGWLKFWLASQADVTNLQITTTSLSYVPERVAKTGEWTLYRVYIGPESVTEATIFDPKISFDAITSNVFIDDIKFQPKESQSTCYVYDIKSLRLLTVFDDQHFGMYYIYNSEGQLVRKMIETERGMKVLSETQYNVPSENR